MNSEHVEVLRRAAAAQPAGVEGVEAVLQNWLDWCNEHNEEPEARSGARIAIEALTPHPAAVDGWVLVIKPDRDGETGVWAVNDDNSIWVSALAGRQGGEK